MIWARIIGDELIGPVRVPQDVKLSSATYCQFLKNVLEPWLEEVPLMRLKKVVSCMTMHLVMLPWQPLNA